MARATVRANVGTLLIVFGAIAAIGLGVLWAMFLVEHVHEWYIKPEPGQRPPLWVGVAMVAHATMVIGLFASVRWRTAGSAVALAGTMVFLGLTLSVRDGSVSGAWIVLINLVPAAMFAAARAIR